MPDPTHSTGGHGLFAPRLRTLEHEGHGHHASWLELFFDLVIVVAISQLAHLLEHESTALGFAMVALLYTATFLGWQGFSMYADRFDTDDVLFRIAVFIQMLLFLIISMQMDDVLVGEYRSFALAFAGLRIILVLQYLNIYRHIEVARPLAKRYCYSYAISAVIWIISVFVPAPWYLVLWVGALLFDLCLPWVTLNLSRAIPTDPEHVQERVGLFTIIVLGELVVSVSLGISDLVLTTQAVIIALAGFLSVLGLWWLYFDPLSGRGFDRKRVRLLLKFVYAHWPLLGGLVFVAGGIAQLIEHPGEVNESGTIALCGGLIAFLLALILADAQLLNDLRHEVILARFVVIGVLILLVIVWPTSLATVLVCSGSMVALAVFETIMSRTQKQTAA